MIPERQLQPDEPRFEECNCCELAFTSSKLVWDDRTRQVLCEHCLEELLLTSIN